MHRVVFNVSITFVAPVIYHIGGPPLGKRARVLLEQAPSLVAILLVPLRVKAGLSSSIARR